MVNKASLIGNIGKIETNNTKSGVLVVNMSLATSESYKDESGNWQDRTEWHDLVLFGKVAERAQNVEKGNTLYVEGKISYRTWQDRDGNNRRKTEILVSYFRKIPRSTQPKHQNQPQNQNQNQNRNQNQPQNRNQNQNLPW